jgi:hypothetical protein
MIPNPAWLDAKFPNEAKLVKRPCLALVSTDKLWITYVPTKFHALPMLFCHCCCASLLCAMHVVLERWMIMHMAVVH